MTARFADQPQQHGRASHLARPGKRAVVAPDLAELHGPRSGTIELPHRMFWYPDRRFNLDDRAYLRWMYQTVLCEALTVGELRTWLDRDTLVRLWPALHLPRGVRQVWQERHPELSR